MANSVGSPLKRVRLRNDEEGQKDIDRISDLPDAVVCHILSFLPTKTSVATSILSKRWVDLWTIVPVLSFSYVELMGTFVDSVHKVLTMCRTQTIRRFSLDFKLKSTVDKEHLETWITAAIRHNVQELKISLHDPLETVIRLPDNMFSCKTLVSLELLEDVIVDWENVCFPSLKILRLERVFYANDKSLSRLLSGCPILEDLIVERASDDNMLTMDINVPSLKKFTVKNTISDLVVCEILINAPLLERMVLLDTRCFVSQVEDLPNLVEATILLDICYNDVVRLIKVIYNSKFMSFSHQFFMDLCCFTCWVSDLLVLPVYRNLAYLEITTGCVHWDGLVALFKCSDNLKALVVHIKVPLYHMGRKCDQSLPESVPKCVSMSLKTLKLTGFCNQDCNWKLVRYILRNAKFLRQMKIGSSSRLMKQRRRLKNLLKYPRASMACEIGFFIDASGEEVHL